MCVCVLQVAMKAVYSVVFQDLSDEGRDHRRDFVATLLVRCLLHEGLAHCHGGVVRPVLGLPLAGHEARGRGLVGEGHGCDEQTGVAVVYVGKVRGG